MSLDTHKEPKEKIKFTPEQWAIVKHVWSLNTETRNSLVAHQVYLKLSSQAFLSALNQDDLIRDFFIVDSKLRAYEVCYQETSVEVIEAELKKNSEHQLLICLRRLRSLDTKVPLMLVRNPAPGFNLSTYVEFNTKKAVVQP